MGSEEDFIDRVADLIGELTSSEVQLLVVAAEEDQAADDEDYSEFKDALEEALLGRL
ncbi:MAG TPA: hypothetical protein VMX15_00145 [Candidatus Heimdallarchaeota archaeon]|nr:hypothetical protein [Candidatus Heimdallarchaeota archaeon]